MREHHTKVKGNLAVLKIKADAYQKGWLPLQPESEHEEFDLALYKDGEFLRVQVKYSSIKDDGLHINLRTSWADKQGTHISFVDKSKVDMFAVYCEEIDKCFYVPIDKIEVKTTLTLKLEKPRTIGVLEAKDFREIISCPHSSTG